MFLAMLFRSFKLYTIRPIIAVQTMIVKAVISVIKSLFNLDDSFIAVNFISVSYVKNVSTDFRFFL